MGDAEAGLRAPLPCPFRKMTFHAGVQRKVINRTPEAAPASTHPPGRTKSRRRAGLAPMLPRGREVGLTLPHPCLGRKPPTALRGAWPLRRGKSRAGGIPASPVDRRASGRKSQAGELARRALGLREGPGAVWRWAGAAESCPGPKLSLPCWTLQGTQPSPGPTDGLPTSQHLRWLGRRPSGAFFCGLSSHPPTP